MEAMSLSDQPLPLLWTGDFIPADGPEPGSTVYIVGEFNCSCVGITFFGKGCGPDKDLCDVPDADFEEGMRLCKLIGEKAVEGVKEQQAKTGGGAAPAAAAGGRQNTQLP